MPQNTLETSYLVFLEFLMLSKRRLIEVGAQQGLTTMQAMSLFLLAEPRSMQAFKRIYNCDASNVTGIIDGLEQKQLVTRYENRQDRRIKCVKLTPKGAKARTALFSGLTSQDSPLFAQLTADEFHVFIDLLAKLNKSAAT